ncbi:MAG: CoB--CoM heterodisulfide reductase iron-sulfur subunit A family protein [Acidobacteria bacterium]|nr:CoB--CoM heterodisulfide reductase iron-sulfur subunit A family protein [Acidobacteriota bacterium]
MSTIPSETDALVIGGGIAGLQAALDLAEQGYQVAVVERQPSIGGAMIRLSKVFPTLDCASCITTPKMAAAAHHDNITLLTYTEVDSLTRQNGGFTARLTKKPRFVKEDLCIGCRLCEYACTSSMEDEFQGGYSGLRAIHIPFSNAIPQVALVDENACTLCGQCISSCPTDAIDLEQKPQTLEIQAKTVIVATGWKLTPIDAKPQYRGDSIANVISPLQMERLLAPHGPYGRVLRPADGKVPDSIAYVQCAGSRDATLGVPYCSRVCCMYAIKQAMLLSGAVPLADITIYYMDIRTFGKGFEEFYQNAKAMGIEFIKGKVARITENPDRSVKLRFEHIDGFGQVEERQHDLVVLSLGMLPGDNPGRMLPIETGNDGFVMLPHAKDAPCNTGVEGVFVAGTATGPKDIVDSIVEAGAAATEAAIYMKQTGITSNKSESRVL